MNFVHEFDLGIKKSYVSLNELNKGYSLNGRTYTAYDTEDSWKNFIKEMKTNYQNAFEEYSKGKGGELEQKNNRPPKMASYGSSSRMIYLLGRDISNFVFEKELPFIINGTKTTPFLDGFLTKENTDIFIEAKCREIYSNHSVVEISTKYLDLYNYINHNTNSNFSYTVSDSNTSDKKKISFFVQNTQICHFDLKQMICHLLGIATNILSSNYNNTKISFIYLLFNPTNLDIDPKYKNKIIEIYNQTVNECNSIDFKNLFSIILDYLIDTNHYTRPANLNTIINSFTFELCDQTNFKQTI